MGFGLSLRSWAGLVGRDGQREEEDGLLAIVCPRPQLAVPVLLQTHKPVLIRVLFGDIRVVMVLLDPLKEQALLAQQLLKESPGYRQ